MIAGSLSRGHSFSRLTALGLLALFSAACGSIPKTHYYTLTTPSAPPAHSARTRYVLYVEPFRAPSMLRDDRIIYYKSPTELGYYQYHRWSTDPATLMTELVSRTVEDMGAFRRVVQAAGPSHPDYLLRGRVLNFDEVDYEGSGKGRVGLELELLHYGDGKVIWSSREEAEQSIEGKGIETVVNALNAASQKLVDQMLSEMTAAVTRAATDTQSQSH